MKPCEAAREILKVTERPPGGAPGFAPYHVSEALLTIDREPGVGRPRLQRRLGLGEAATRTLMQRLVLAGLAERIGRGLKLTNLGEELLSSISKSIAIYQLDEPLVDEWGDTRAVLVGGVPPPRTLTDVYRFRDYLVEEGCRTAVVAGLDGDNVQAPGLPDYLRDRLASLLLQSIGAPTMGLLLVIPGECLASAVNAALRILASSCSETG